MKLLFAPIIFLAILEFDLAAQPKKISITSKPIIINLNQFQAVSSDTIVAPSYVNGLQKNPWKVSTLYVDQAAREFREASSQEETYQNIHDFKYDDVNKQLALIAEKDTSINPNETSTQSFIITSDINKTKTLVSSFYYNFFDESGYVGCINSSKKSIYKRYDGKEVSFSSVPNVNIISLGSVNKRGISIIRSDLGFFLFDVISSSRISNFYNVSLWSFLPNVFVAKNDVANTIIVTDVNNRVSDSTRTYSNVNQIPGKKTCLDLYTNENEHFLQTSDVDIFPIPGYNSARGDVIFGYSFQDSLLIRFREKVKNRDLYAVLNLSGNSFDLDTVLTLKDTNISVYPFYGRYYLSKHNDGKFYLTDLSHPILLSNDGSRNIYNVNNPFDKKSAFFIYANNDEANSTTIKLIKLSALKAPKIETTDKSICKHGRPFVSFKNNILSVKDESLAMDDKRIGGWKFIDAYKACYPDDIDQEINDSIIPRDQKYFSDSNNEIKFPAFYSVDLPFAPSEPSSGEKIMKSKALFYQINQNQQLKSKLIFIDYVAEILNIGNNKRNNNSK